MALLSLAAPAAEPISLVEAKAWLRLDTADDDAVVTPLIVAARQAVEAEARVRLISQTLALDPGRLAEQPRAARALRAAAQRGGDARP